MMKKKEFVIWNDMYFFDDMEKLYEEYFGEEAEYMTDEAKYREVEADIWDCLDVERMNLNIDVEDDIIVIGNIGRWDGRVTGYKEIDGNISNCLYSDCDYSKWYVDNLGDLRSINIHHDGTNYCLYRVWKNVSEEQKENFREKIYRGKMTRRDITRYTRKLGDDIQKVYGYNM